MHQMQRKNKESIAVLKVRFFGGPLSTVHALVDGPMEPLHDLKYYQNRKGF